jgi:hypothetical protein
MNKAFVRESDSTDVLCPKCGGAGTESLSTAVASFVPAERRKTLAATVFFCPTPTCPVAYFDALEGSIDAEELTQPVCPKNPAAPLCGCFGLTRDDVAADVAEGTPRRIRELLAKSKSPAARCETASPTGRSCLPDVQRYYFKLRANSQH